METGRSIWSAWSPVKRKLFVVGLLLIVGLASVIGWWATRTPYGVLFSGLRDVDAAEITTALDSWQVPHRFADGGATLLVPEESVYDTRMKLVGQGIPHGGSVGFEVFKDSDFGVTEFAQHVNYQRALQGELERTITSLPDVQTARVHLTLRKASMFDTNEAPSKASVSLTLKPGVSLASAQVTGIQRLVASAVDGLTPEAVAVLGNGGVPLSGRVAGDGGEEQARVESRLRQRVQDLLRDAVGMTSGSTVSVDVTLNYDRVHQVRERLVEQGKDGNGLLVHQRTANSRGTVAPATDETARQPGGSGETDTEYAHGRDQEDVELAPGRIQRLSIGVVVPANTAPAAIASLREVIAASVGLDAARGDQLDIAALGGVPVVAAKPAAVKAPTASAVAPVVPDTTMPWWPFAVGGLIAVCGVGTIPLVLRRRRVPRLTHQEREAALRDVRQWMDSSEISR
jgi:flagellar M-ring protein FliF